MNVLITGGGGFLGAAVVSRLLDCGAQVRVLGRTNKQDRLVYTIGSKANAVAWRCGDIADTRKSLQQPRGVMPLSTSQPC